MAKTSFNKRKVHGPPEGQNWCWLTRELLESPAWRARSIHCVRLIDFLMHEHLSHAGLENGHLVAPYGQLAAWGISKRLIGDAIVEAEWLKLIVAHHGGKRAYTKAAATRFRITFYATRETPPDAPAYWIEPGNEWKHVTAEHVQRARQKKFRRTHMVNHSRFTMGTTAGSHDEPLTLEKPKETAMLKTASVVHTVGVLSISRIDEAVAGAGNGDCNGGASIATSGIMPSLMLKLLAGSPTACLLTLAGAQPLSLADEGGRADGTMRPRALKKSALAKAKKGAASETVVEPFAEPPGNGLGRPARTVH